MQHVALCLLLIALTAASRPLQLLRCCATRAGSLWRARPVTMISREDAESNQRLVQALFGDDGLENVVAKDPELASHLQLEYNDDGSPTQLRFAYVDEPSCTTVHKPVARTPPPGGAGVGGAGAPTG